MFWGEPLSLLVELESGEDSMPESGFELDEAGLALSGVVDPAVAEERPSVVVEEAASEDEETVTEAWEAVPEVEAVSSEVGLTTDLLRLRDVTEAMEEAAKARSGQVSEGSNPGQRLNLQGI